VFIAARRSKNQLFTLPSLGAAQRAIGMTARRGLPHSLLNIESLPNDRDYPMRIACVPWV
jgi:hypothetical protein